MYGTEAKMVENGEIHPAITALDLSLFMSAMVKFHLLVVIADT